LRRRFFVERFEGASAALRGEAAHHLGRVLRAQPGQLYELSDGRVLWLARAERIGRDAIEFTLLEPLPTREPHLHLILLLAIVKFDRFEWSLEKATELGVGEIVPLAAARSEKALVSAAAKRIPRWQKILLEAAQQSRRLRPPVLRASARPAEAFRQTQAAIRILLSEQPDVPLLRTVLEEKLARQAARGAETLNGGAFATAELNPRPAQGAWVALAVGPEGGWTVNEVLRARAADFLEASLGANILRTETAVITALASLNYALGD